MKNKRIFGGLALALAGMTALAACSSSGSSSSTPSSSSSASSVKSGGTFTYALDQDVAGFNVLQANDNEFVLQEIIEPGLAAGLRRPRTPSRRSWTRTT